VGHITGMSKKMMNIVLIWDFEVLVFFDFWSPFHWWPFDLWFALKQPSFIAGNHTAQNVWLWIFFDFLQNAKTNFVSSQFLPLSKFGIILGQTFIIFRFFNMICDTAYYLSIMNSAMILVVTWKSHTSYIPLMHIWSPKVWHVQY
jgi:hypothetical protein